MDPLSQNTDIVKGSKLSDIFHHLLKKKTLVKVSIRELDVERLLIIDEIDEAENKANHFHFRIELGDDLSRRLTDKSFRQIGLEFLGPEHLPYQCEVLVNSLNDTHLWLKSPKQLHRFQLRNNFRIQDPKGVQLKITINQLSILMNISNISIGGVYCNVDMKLKKLLERKKSIKGIELIFDEPKSCCRVHIQSAQLRRLEDGSSPGKFGIAFEFIKILPEEKKKLIGHIYELQREYLKNRIQINEKNNSH